MIEQTDHVYLSGPMSGLKNENRTTFHDVELMIREKYGCNVINPAWLSELMGHDRTWEHYLTVDLALVRTSTVMVLLPNWESSPGAREEAAEAVLNGLRVIRFKQIEGELEVLRVGATDSAVPLNAAVSATDSAIK